MSTHSHTHHRPALPPRSGRRPGPRQDRIVHPAMLAFLLAVAIAALVIAGSTLKSGADSVGAEHAAQLGRTPVTLPGGARGVERQGIIHAPDSYSPPGLWRGRGGPVLR